jgi:hypothetical protein
MLTDIAISVEKNVFKKELRRFLKYKALITEIQGIYKVQQK